jgi:NAD(P)-dependent dehydrogenase (short-subunit alcohol dehydrogenase family)
MNTQVLKGKTALISGAGRNNGKAIALTFAREGADVILIAKQRRDSLDAVARECESYGVQVLAMLADVGNPEEVRRVVAAGLERFGKIDVLVCVAATRNYRPLCEYTDQEWVDTFAVNVHSAFYLAKAVLPGMVERKSGNIIAMGAVLSLTAHGDKPLETACKHALYGLIKSMAIEFGPHGIRVNLLVPGNIDNERANPAWYDARREKGEEAPLLLGRKGTTQEVANVALFLASDQSSYVTGDRIICGGGKYI